MKRLIDYSYYTKLNVYGLDPPDVEGLRLSWWSDVALTGVECDPEARATWERGVELALAGKNIAARSKFITARLWMMRYALPKIRGVGQ